MDKQKTRQELLEEYRRKKQQEKGKSSQIQKKPVVSTPKPAAPAIKAAIPVKPRTLGRKGRETQTDQELINAYVIDLIRSMPVIQQSPLAAAIKDKGPFVLHTQRKVTLITSLSGTGLVLRRSEVRIPPLDLFSLRDALEASDPEIARAIFRVLVSKRASGIRISYAKLGNTVRHKYISKVYRERADVWIAWAFREEQWGNFENVVQVFEEAEEAIEDQEELELLRTDFRMFLIRLSHHTEAAIDQRPDPEDSKPHVSFVSESVLDEEASPVAPKLISDMNDDAEDAYIEYLGKAYNIPSKYELPVSADATPRPSKPRARKSTPFVRKTEVVKAEEEEISGPESLESSLKGLSLAPSSVLKSGAAKKKQVGVRFASDEAEGAAVTVLTPVRPKKKDRQALGVDVAITPVRRSLRLFNDKDYVPSASQIEAENAENVAPDAKLKTLLEENGYAYIPNKAIPVDPKMASARRKSMHSALKKLN